MSAFGQSKERGHSVSIGNASSGELINGKALPLRSANHRVAASTKRSGYYWGSNELVAAVQRVSKDVAKDHPNSVLLVGNMSRRHGGDLRGSVSHNSGRDVDLGFFAQSTNRKPVQLRRLRGFDRHGRSGRLQFDDARNWQVVKSLITNADIQVQWMFVSEPLRLRLLAHAATLGENQTIIQRASQVLSQPGNSSKHNDHFHVRLYCARHERLQGCVNYGPIWPWIDDHQQAVDDYARALSVKIKSADSDTALQAIEAIHVIHGASARVALIDALLDERNSVKKSALKTLASLGTLEEDTLHLIGVWKQTPPGAWRIDVLRTLTLIGDARVAPVLHAMLEQLPPVSPPMRVLACQGLAKHAFGPAVPTLAAQLTNANRGVRNAAMLALENITNHSFGRGKRGKLRWERWWKANENKTRIEWVTGGFKRRHGIQTTPPVNKRSLVRLVGLIGQGGPTAQNARWLIQQHTDFYVDRAHYSDADLQRFYKKWLRTRGQ